MNRPSDIAVFVVTIVLVAVFLGIGALLWRWLEGPRTGNPAADHASRMRAASWVFPLLPAISAGMCGLALAVGVSHPAIWIATGSSAALVVGIHLFFRHRALKLPAKSTATPTSPWTWVLLVAAFGLTLNGLGSGPGPAGAPLAGVDRSVIWVCFAVPVILVFSWVMSIRVQLRLRDGAVMRALHRSAEGDGDGAIAELQHEIEMQGPTANRINGLAVLYLKKKDYATAEGWCRKGLAIDPKRFDLRSNFALCRLQTGHAEEAEAMFAELAAAQPVFHPGVFENHARALMALGRLDEAETQLDRAETTLKRVFFLTTLDMKGPIRAEIATARAEIAALRGKVGSRGFDEL